MIRRAVAALLGVACLWWATPTTQAQESASGSPPGTTPVAGVPALVGAETSELYHSDVSPPLRSMYLYPPRFQDHEEHPVKRLPHHHPASAPGSRPDLALQLAGGPALSATPGLSFDGAGVPNYGVNSAPPDTVGAVGATQYVQWVNTAFEVFDKATGARIFGPADGNTLWQGFGGGCENNNDGDPIVSYDQAANRWIMTQFSVSTTPFLQCIAVSTTSDATGSYRRFAYQFTDFNDYPKLGVWPDAYYITYNMFNAAGTAFLGSKLCAYDRNQMITASGTPGPQECFQLSSSFGGVLPSDLDGSSSPPAGSPNYMVAFDDAGLNGLNLWKLHVDWANPAAATLTGPVKVTTTAFSEACGGGTCITQPGTSQTLDSLADRLMYRLAYRNFGDHESLVVNHSVDVGGHSGVRWYELRSPGGTPTVFQQGTFSPDSNHRWMGSIAMDQAGNILLGYSVSGSVRPSVRVTGRLAGDALGTLQAETELQAGTGVQTATLSRWGDYSAMTVDPSDDCTFWYTQEYIKANGTFNWSTRVGTFKFAGCGGVVVPDYALSASPGSLSVTQGSSGSSTVGVTSLNGFSSAVTLAASGLPSGVTAAFSGNPVTPPAGGSASSTLTFTAGATAATGTATVTVTGTSGATSHSTSVSLTVNPSGGGGAQTAVFDTTLQAPQCATAGTSCDTGPNLVKGRDTMSGGPETNQPNTINDSCADGSSGTYLSDESIESVKLTSVDGTPFAAGKQVRLDVVANVWAGGPASDHMDLYFAANAQSPAWQAIQTNITPSAGGLQTFSATYTLPAGGSLQAVRANFRYQGSASSCSAGSFDDHDDLVFAVAGGGGGGGSELIVNGGFEGSASPWVLASNFVWSTGAFPHGGTGYILNNSVNNLNTTAYQQLSIPGSAAGTLSFWLNVTSNETTTTTQFDKLLVEVRNTAGTVLATLGTFSNLNKGTAGVYSQRSFDMSAYKGQTVRLTFHVTTDGSLTTNFRIDDVSLK